MLAGLLAAAVVDFLGQRRVVAAPADYENRGQRCSVTVDPTGIATNDCNSPCRTCENNRCVYACTRNQVCDANAVGCDPAINKGCCV